MVATNVDSSHHLKVQSLPLLLGAGRADPMRTVVTVVTAVMVYLYLFTRQFEIDIRWIVL